MNESKELSKSRIYTDYDFSKRLSFSDLSDVPDKCYLEDGSSILSELLPFIKDYQFHYFCKKCHNFPSIEFIDDENVLYSCAKHEQEKIPIEDFFDPNNKFLGCSSNVGTIHIFSLSGIMKILNENNNDDNKKGRNNFDEEPKNTKSLLGKIGGLLGVKSSYLETERNFAKYKVQEENSLLGFGYDNTIVVITMEGKYYKAAYDPKKGGDCCKIEEKNIFVDN